MRTSRLYNFLYEDHRRRWRFYLLTMAVAFSWGCISSLVFDQPEDTVTYQVLAICVLAHIGLLSYYLLGGRSVAETKKKRIRKKRPAETVTPAVSSWRFPRLLPYAGAAVALLSLAMANINLRQFDAKVVGVGLKFLPVSAVGASVPRILDNARDHDVVLNPTTLRKSGLKFIGASEKQPSAWSATKAALDYLSFVNGALNLTPKVTNPKDITPNLPNVGPYMFSLNLRPSPQSGMVWAARVKTEGDAPPEASARLESLASPQPRGSGARLILIEGKSDTIVLDGQYLKNVIIREASVEYNGGPVRLENVYFVNCEFKIAPNEAGRALAKAIFQSGATNFRHGI
jgi:hypothetical protein